jgi:hypothetical protein
MKSLYGLVVSLCTIAGCAGIEATEYVDTRIAAYAQSESFPGKRFVLQGPDPSHAGGDPSWPVYAGIVTRALEARGFVLVDSSPDLFIQVTYTVGDSGITNIASNSVISSTLRTVQLEATDAVSQAAGRPKVVWSVRARSRGTDDDLEKVFPFIVAAMEDYIGANAPHEVIVSKYGNDKEVSRLQKP